jgi:hypothetical protein
MADVNDSTLCLVVTFGGLGTLVGSIYPLPISTSTQLQPSTTLFAPYRSLIARDKGMPIIDVANTGVSPIRGDPQQGTLDVEIVIPDVGEETIAAYFAASNARPVCYALTDLPPNGTQFLVDPAELAASGIGPDTVIYWNREAFVVEGVDLIAGGIEVVNAIPGGTRTANGAVGVLGHLGTYLENHVGEKEGQLPPYNDSRIYLVNPFLKDREICVWQTDGVAQETVHSRYYLESAVWTNDQTTLHITARDVLAVLSDQQINSAVTTYTIPDGAAGISRGGTNPISSYAFDFDLNVAGTNQSSSLLRNAAGGLVKIGDVIMWGALTTWNVDDLNDYGTGYLTLYDSERLMVLNNGVTADASSMNGGIFEVLSSNPDYYQLRGATFTSPYWNSVTGLTAIHPLDLLRCHLGSLKSQLPSEWKAKIPQDHIDDSAIVRLRDTVYADWQWKGIVQVCDGSSTGLLAWLTEKILRPLGASFTVNSSGQLTVRSLFDTADTSLPTIGDEAILAGRGVAFDLEVGVDAIKANTAIYASGEYATQIFGTGAYLSSFGLTRQSQIVDLNAEGLVSVADFRSSSEGSIQRYAERLARIAALFRLRAQTVTLKVLMTSACEAGQYRLMRIRGLRDPDTGKLSEDVLTRIGYIIYVENEPRTGVAVIKSILYPFTPTRIGPSARVTAGNDTSEFVCETDYFIAPRTGSPAAYVYAPSTGGQVIRDSLTFAPGDLIIMRSYNLAVITRPSAVISISGNVMITEELETLDNGDPYLPIAGDIVTWADYAEWAGQPPVVYASFAFYDLDTFGI